MGTLTQNVAKTLRQEMKSRSGPTKRATTFGLYIAVCILPTIVLSTIPKELAIKAGERALGESFFWIYLILCFVTAISIWKAWDHSKNEAVLVERLQELEIEKEKYIILLTQKSGNVSDDEMIEAHLKAKGKFFYEEHDIENAEGFQSHSWSSKQGKFDAADYMEMLNTKPPQTLEKIKRCLSASEGIGNKSKYPSAIWAPHRNKLLELKKRHQKPSLTMD